MHNKTKSNTEFPQTMGSTLNNISTTTNIIISSTFDNVSHAIKKKSCGKIKKSQDPPTGLSPVTNLVLCPIVSDNVQFKLQISNLNSLDIIHYAFLSNSLLKMIFSIDTSVFIPEFCVSDNPIRHKHTRTPTNDHKYYHAATRNDRDLATLHLRSKPRPQSNTIHLDEFKRFKLIVALSWMFRNPQDSSPITMVLLGFAPMSLRSCYDFCRCITT